MLARGFQVHFQYGIDIKGIHVCVFNTCTSIPHRSKGRVRQTIFKSVIIRVCVCVCGINSYHTIQNSINWTQDSDSI